MKHQGVFFSREPTVPTVNRIIVHFYDNSQATSTLRAVTSSGRSVPPGETTHSQGSEKVELFKSVIIGFIGLLETFRRQNIALNMWKIVKKVLKCCLRSCCSTSASKSRRWSRMLEMWNSADKVPSAVGTCLAGGGEFSSPQNFFSLTFPSHQFF